MRCHNCVNLTILIFDSNARLVQGFEQDLRLQGQQYATILSILFVGYIVMQVLA
jgi:hypothetical protein